MTEASELITCQTSNIRHTLVGNIIVDNRRSWSIACRRCSNYIFIINLTPGFNGLGKDNCKTRWETLKFWNLVCLILVFYGNDYFSIQEKEEAAAKRAERQALMEETASQTSGEVAASVLTSSAAALADAEDTMDEDMAEPDK